MWSGLAEVFGIGAGWMEVGPDSEDHKEPVEGFGKVL